MTSKTITPDDVVEGVEKILKTTGIECNTKAWYMSRELWSAVGALALILVQAGLGAPINPTLFYMIETMLLTAIPIFRSTSNPTKLLFGKKPGE